MTAMRASAPLLEYVPLLSREETRSASFSSALPSGFPSLPIAWDNPRVREGHAWVWYIDPSTP